VSRVESRIRTPRIRHAPRVTLPQASLVIAWTVLIGLSYHVQHACFQPRRGAGRRDQVHRMNTTRHVTGVRTWREREGEDTPTYTRHALFSRFLGRIDYRNTRSTHSRISSFSTDLSSSSTMKLVIALLALASASAFTTTSPFVTKSVSSSAKFSTRYVTLLRGS
jgi:hypothetical protein